MKRARHVVSAALALVAATAVFAGVGVGPVEAATGQVTPLTPAALASASTASLFPGGLFVQPKGVAATQARVLQAAGRPADAAAAAYIGKRSTAIWLGPWLSGSALVSYLTTTLAEAEAAGTTPVFVTYAIPDRDCGGYSAGGLTDATYPVWNDTIATTLAGHRAVVLVEPDSLGQSTTCPAVSATRLPLLATAVKQFAANGVPAYLDGGFSRWLTPEVAASLLNKAGIGYARGFFTNVANYVGVTQERAYADKISVLTGGAHFVIDVSRNGQGWRGTWCNAPGAGLGQDPHVTAGTSKLDALLWVKTPGASDGTCNGGPAAGAWFASYADSLVRLKK